MSKRPFQATSLRKFLIFLMIVVVLAVVGGFYTGLQTIREYAVEVSHASQDASASDGQVTQLKILQDQLAQARALVERADKIFATDANYQPQAVTDLQRYAGEAGVAITNIDFTQPEGQPSSERVVKIALTQPTSYEKLLRFLELVEGSLPKMQVTNIVISRPENPSGDQVNVEDITIRIAVK